MRRKVFKLEKVLHFRRETEKLRKMEFAAAKCEYEVAEDRLRREEESMDQVTLEFMDRQIEGINALELQLYSDYLVKKREEVLRQRQQVITLDRKMLEKKEDLIEAATDKKIMEELKNKKVRAHDKAVAEKEQAFLDEIALQGKGLRV